MQAPVMSHKTSHGLSPGSSLISLPSTLPLVHSVQNKQTNKQTKNGLLLASQIHQLCSLFRAFVLDPKLKMNICMAD